MKAKEPAPDRRKCPPRTQCGAANGRTTNIPIRSLHSHLSADDLDESPKEALGRDSQGKKLIEKIIEKLI